MRTLNFERTGILFIGLCLSILNATAETELFANQMLPAFNNIYMIDGAPGTKPAYGYSGWAKDMGYVSFHNPSDKDIEFEVVFDRSTGVPENVKLIKSSFLLKKENKLPGSKYAY